MTPLSVLFVFAMLWMAQAQGNVDTERSSRSSDQSTLVSDGDDRDAAPFVVRLHLVRHGETIANTQNIVLGQGDSPLTDDGLALAKLAADSDAINGRGVRYWRAYCSDLHRAHRTARIVLRLEDGEGNAVEPSDVDLIADSRLRELAKGAREGHPKSLTEELAMAARRKQAGAENSVAMRVPTLESIDEAWGRVRLWIDSVVEEASEDYYASDGRTKDEDGACNASENETERKIYDVFALSHSALIRTMIHKMVEDELPSDYATTNEGSLLIPNLSRTVIDIRPGVRRERLGDGAPKVKWTPTLFRLTDVSHLRGPPPGRPPYL